jgi:four helix bundle protein
VGRADSKAEALQKRLVSFSAEIVQLSTKLPKTMQAKHIAKQILRPGTAAAANYGEARGAESRSDFMTSSREIRNSPSAIIRYA